MLENTRHMRLQATMISFNSCLSACESSSLEATTREHLFLGFWAR